MSSFELYQLDPLACPKCGRKMTGENFSRDSRGYRRCRDCKNRSARERDAVRQQGETRRKRGRPRLLSVIRVEAPPQEPIRPEPIDHTKCDPRDVGTLCDECGAIFNEARRATA